jgi:hypothetical protein
MVFNNEKHCVSLLIIFNIYNNQQIFMSQISGMEGSKRAL